MIKDKLIFFLYSDLKHTESRGVDGNLHFALLPIDFLNIFKTAFEDNNQFHPIAARVYSAADKGC